MMPQQSKPPCHLRSPVAMPEACLEQRRVLPQMRQRATIVPPMAAPSPPADYALTSACCSAALCHYLEDEQGIERNTNNTRGVCVKLWGLLRKFRLKLNRHEKLRHVGKKLVSSVINAINRAKSADQWILQEHYRRHGVFCKKNVL